MNSKFYRRYLNKTVKVGIPHYTQPRLFYVEGELIDVEDQLLVIANEKGLRRVSIEDVREFTIVEAEV